MNVVLLAPEFDYSDAWRTAVEAAVPGLRLVAEGEVDANMIDAAVVDNPPPGRLQQYRHLRVILSLSAGVDTLLADPTLPKVPIVRLVAPEMVALMREYVVYHVLRIHRRFADLEALQRERRWVWLPAVPSARSRRVAVLGLGHLGRPSAEALHMLGFDVRGWSRTKKRIPGITCFAGAEGLDALLPETDILVSLLPLTDGTRGLLAARLFSQLPFGASVINVGRGGCLNEDDLVQALDSGHLSHATLDVCAIEPLPPDHPLWRHSRITITPHMAAYPSPNSFIDPIATALSRTEQRERRVKTTVDPSRGY
jgi:glyoxylate/hydroxypyruvate reductase A